MKTFFFFGDSLTLGVNDKGMLGWTGRLSMQMDLPVPPTTFYNLGARKHTSKAVCDRWKHEVESRVLPESDVRLMFCFGVVDMAAPQGEPLIPVEKSVQNLEKLLVEVKEQYSADAVRILSPFPVAQETHCKRIAELNAAYSAACATHGIDYIDLFSAVVEYDAYMNDLQDGVHPGGEGCSIIAEFLHNTATVKNWID